MWWTVIPSVYVICDAISSLHTLGKHQGYLHVCLKVAGILGDEWSRPLYYILLSEM